MNGTQVRKAALLFSATAMALALASGCAKKKNSADDGGSAGAPGGGDGGNIPAAAGTLAFSVTAGGFDSGAAGAALLERAADGFNLSVSAPTGDEYQGIGINFGDAVVEGFKIRLTQIFLGTSAPGQAGGKQTLVFDWSKAPKELEIARGFNGTISDKADIKIDPGSYNYMSLQYQDNYDIKAYAYLDRDNDGTVDSTIYTTKDDVVLAAGQVIKPADLAALHYDYYHYSFTNLNSKSTDRGPTAVDSADTTGGLTLFKDPVVVTDDTKDLSVNLLIAVDRVARVWDGRYGDGAPYVVGDGHIPSPGMPFPKSDNDTRGGNVNARYPANQPDFALDYIPSFGFVNSPDLTSEAYMISNDSNFIGYNSQTFILVRDKDGVPLIGRILINDNGVSPHLGQAAKVFTKEADDTYTFYSEYGVKDANGVDDGGFFYTNDIKAAGFAISGFQPLDAVGDTAQITVTDGPRCKAEYDYCAKSATNDLGVSPSADGTRHLFIKRFR